MAGTARTRKPWTYLMALNGVLVQEDGIVPGADAFVAELVKQGTPFMVFTNSSIYTPRDVQTLLLRHGVEIPQSAVWTSALVTAQFLHNQRPGGSAYVIGEAGLTAALYDVG